MIKLFEKYEDKKYIIIKILFIKIIFKKKLIKSNINVIAWWIPIKRWRDEFRKIFNSCNNIVDKIMEDNYNIEIQEKKKNYFFILV